MYTMTISMRVSVGKVAARIKLGLSVCMRPRTAADETSHGQCGNEVCMGTGMFFTLLWVPIIPNSKEYILTTHRKMNAASSKRESSITAEKKRGSKI